MEHAVKPLTHLNTLTYVRALVSHVQLPALGSCRTQSMRSARSYHSLLRIWLSRAICLKAAGKEPGRSLQMIRNGYWLAALSWRIWRMLAQHQEPPITDGVSLELFQREQHARFTESAVCKAYRYSALS